MSFPQVQSITATTFASDTTAHAVNMPATVNAGDLLFCIFVNDANTSVTTPSGWTSITSQTFSTRTGIYAKIASGSEDGTTVDFVTSVAETAAAQVYRITGIYGDTTSNAITTASASGTGSTPNPPDLNPANWGTEETLWIAAASCSDPVTGVTTYPSSYTNGIYSQSGSGTTHVQLASARRENSVSAENPNTFTLDASAPNGWLGITIAIRPEFISQTIEPPILTNEPTFYGPELALFGLLIPPLLDNTPTLYEPNLAYEQILIPDDVLTITPIFYDAAMRYSITAPLLTNSPTFYDVTIINTQVLAPALFTVSPTFYGPEFRGPRNIGMPLLTNSPTFYGPEIFTVWANTDSLTSDTWTDTDYPT